MQDENFFAFHFFTIAYHCPSFYFVQPYYLDESGLFLDSGIPVGCFDTERNFQRKMKFSFSNFMQFCITGNQIWHKQRIIRDTIHGNDKSVDKAQSVDTIEESNPITQAQILR